MRVRLILNFYCVLIISLISYTTSSAHNFPLDTTKLIAGITKNPAAEVKSVFEAVNVVYPASLQDHRDESWEFIEKFSDQKRNYLIQVYNKGKKYFPKIAEILKRYQLPAELRVLIALESGFNGKAVSRAGATGYWQIMAGVAKEYGLQVASAKDADATGVKKKDDRFNLNKSTVFAARYFSDRRLSLNNDILLMVASYNCGIGRLKKAIRKSGQSSPDFWDLRKYLPAETRNYVLKFIALNVIFENYENFKRKQLVFAPPSADNTRYQTFVTGDSLQNQSVILD